MYDKDAQALIRENASLLEENANLRNLLRTEEALHLKKRSHLSVKSQNARATRSQCMPEIAIAISRKQRPIEKLSGLQ